jgi:hypothetical protein
MCDDSFDIAVGAAENEMDVCCQDGTCMDEISGFVNRDFKAFADGTCLYTCKVDGAAF